MEGCRLFHNDEVNCEKCSKKDRQGLEMFVRVVSLERADYSGGKKWIVGDVARKEIYPRLMEDAGFFRWGNPD